MDNLIYMLPNRIIDAEFDNPAYQHHKWVSLSKLPFLPAYMCSRVHQLDTPWHLAPSLLPMPDLSGQTSNEINFSVVMDSIAWEFCQLINNTDRTPYVRWSGGIDSTAILVGLLRVADTETLNKIIVLCDTDSVAENPYFYNKFIKNQFTVADDTEFIINSTNYNKILLVDGDCAEMIAGSTIAYNQVRLNQAEILNKPWRSVTNLENLICSDTPERATFVIELIKESLNYSQLEINTVYDFFWWYYFNYKINDSLMRSIAQYTRYLTPSESQQFFKTSLHRFYVHQQMQVWSIISLPYRSEKNLLDSKYFFKKYIHDFDCNDFYFYNKHKHRSIPPLWATRLESDSLFAIDQNWNRFSVHLPEHRQLLGQVLGRV
jgi:hypothetical protein